MNPESSHVSPMKRLGWILSLNVWAAIVPVVAQSAVTSARVDELRALLGAAAPDGSGVRVVQSEAPNSTGNCYPQTGSGTFNGSNLSANRDYRGVVFTARSGERGASGHAQAVAERFYERTRGIAPGISSVSLYEASGYQAWTGNFFATSEGRVHNSSWISVSDNFAALQSVIDDADSAALDRGFLHCIGLNNGTGAIPGVYGHAYNCLAVGRSDGSHSWGKTLADFDGPGRMKPDLVGWSSATSYTTPEVSGVAALLYEIIDRQPTLAAANDPNVVRAILLAGADKDFNPSWARDLAAEPYDPVFGAGLLDAFESYRILVGGEQQATTDTDANPFAWAKLNSLDTQRFRFTVPQGQFGTQFSAALSWFREQDGRDAQRTKLTLRLLREDEQGVPQLFEQSNSPVDNVEHLFQRHLLPGTYWLEVPAVTYTTRFFFNTTTRGFDFALAWRLEIGTGPQLRVGSSGALVASDLDPRATYEVQRSETLKEGTWVTVETFPNAARYTASSSDNSLSPTSGFYRLKWSEPTPLP